MPIRFTSNLVLATLGAVLATTALTLDTDVASWIALGTGAAAFAIALFCSPARTRGTSQRGLDALAAIAGIVLAALARTFTGGTLEWTSFGIGCGLAGLAVLGLVLHERETVARLTGRFAGSSNGNGGRSVRRRDPDAELAPAPDFDPIWKWTGPLAKSYWSAALLVVFALVPYLVLSTTVGAVGPQISGDVGLSEQGLSLTNGMSNAAYAVSTVIALQFTVHLRGRRLLVGYASLFVIGSVLAASAFTPGLFVAGRVLQGAATGLMLIAAVPPLVIGWPPERLKSTAMVLNMGIFGAVALGPVLGGHVAGWDGDTWRVLFWIVTGLGAGALVLSILTFFDTGPMDRSAPWSPGVIVLAAAGCGLTFFGSAELTTHKFVSTWVMLPLLLGLAAITVLVLNQYHSKRPLMPMRRLTSTFPIVGIIVALSAGAASVAVIELVQSTLIERGESPHHVANLFLPEFGGALLAAALFGLLFTTKWTKAIALGGLICIAGGAAILTGISGGGGDVLVWVGSGLLGFGVGASVAPALFIAGFSLPSNNVARVFALIELLRAVAAFSFAPIIAHLALTTGGSPAVGTRTAIWICMGVAIVGAVVAVYLFAIARAKPHHPNIDRWIGGTEPAFDSPALAAALRGLESDPRGHSDYPGETHRTPEPAAATSR